MTTNPQLVSSKSIPDQILDIMHDVLSVPDDQKVSKLILLKDSLVFQHPQFIDVFLEDILAFHVSTFEDIRIFLIGFIELSCLRESGSVRTVIDAFSVLIHSDSPSVAKRAISAYSVVYRSAFLLLSRISPEKLSDRSDEMVWRKCCQLRDKVLSFRSALHDGIRCESVRFMESIILLHSFPPNPKADSNAVLSHLSSSSSAELTSLAEALDSLALDSVPPGHPILKVEELQADAARTLDCLLSMLTQQDVSHAGGSGSLQAALAAAASLARSRPALAFAPALLAFEALHANLPPALASVPLAVASIRKMLRLQLIQLIKLPAEIVGGTTPRFSALLKDLGMTEPEIQKLFPKKDDDNELKGRKRKGQRGGTSEEKRSKRREAEDNKPASRSAAASTVSAPSRIIPLEPSGTAIVAPLATAAASSSVSLPFSSSPSTSAVVSSSSSSSSSSPKGKPDPGAIDRNAPEVERLLTRANVVDLVVISNTLLPEQLPAHFVSAYTPVTDAGSPAQIKHLARLLTAQMIAAGVELVPRPPEKQSIPVEEIQPISVIGAPKPAGAQNSNGIHFSDFHTRIIPL